MENENRPVPFWDDDPESITPDFTDDTDFLSGEIDLSDVDALTEGTSQTDLPDFDFEEDPGDAAASDAGSEELDRILSEFSQNPADNDAAIVMSSLSDDHLAGELHPVSQEETPDKMPMLEVFSDKSDSRAKRTSSEEETIEKRRPARKGGYGFFGIPQAISTLVWLALTLVIGVSLGRLIWVCAADVLAFGREDHEVTITITETDTIEDIAAKLQQGGLIRYPKLFLAYADLAHVVEKDKISTGTFTLSTLYDYHALVSAMGDYSPDRETVTVLIPEGYNSRQIFRLLEEKKVCSYDELAQYAADGELYEYWFLENVERGSENCLEGFLAPDTYEFYVDDEPGRVIEKMLDAFEYHFNDRMKDQIITLNERLAEKMRENGYSEEYIAQHYFGVREVVTVASLIEKESANMTESFTIASVFYNRLTDPDSYPYLNSDATIYYALGGVDRELTLEDLQTDSPYNTYTHVGLTPGPIANPSWNSIYAALSPEDTNYHFFIYNRQEGAHHFSVTLAEHEEYAAWLEQQ